MLLSLGIKEADKFKPTTSRPPALHLRFYSSVSVLRGTEGGVVDTYGEWHLEEYILACGNNGEGAYGCCLYLMTCGFTAQLPMTTNSIAQWQGSLC